MKKTVHVTITREDLDEALEKFRPFGIERPNGFLARNCILAVALTSAVGRPVRMNMVNARVVFGDGDEDQGGSVPVTKEAIRLRQMFDARVMSEGNSPVPDEWLAKFAGLEFDFTYDDLAAEAS